MKNTIITNLKKKTPSFSIILCFQNSFFEFGGREDVLVRNRRFLYELSQIIEEVSTGIESCCREGEDCCQEEKPAAIKNKILNDRIQNFI